jgi:hypothetical protein
MYAMLSSIVQYTFGQAGAMRGGGERKSQNLDSSLEEQDENYDTLPAGALRTLFNTLGSLSSRNPLQIVRGFTLHES